MESTMEVRTLSAFSDEVMVATVVAITVSSALRLCRVLSYSLRRVTSCLMPMKWVISPASFDTGAMVCSST